MTSRRTLNKLGVASAAASGAHSDALHEALLNMQTRIATLEALINTNVSVLATGTVHNVPDNNLVTSPAASDLASAIVLLNSLKVKHTAHIASTTAHDLADATNVITADDAADLATSLTLANDVKVQSLAHNANATAHDAADTANDVSAANATDLPTLLVLCADLKSSFNGHLAESNAKGVNTSAAVREAIIVA